MNVTKQLYQWDTGQKLTECTGIYVDYLIGDEVYRVEIIDGTCIIPDELLQTSGRYKVWECMADNTLREFAFKVLPRPVPPNYVFTPTEQLTFEGLVQKETNKFNTNAIEKLNAYNANADNRVAEFNAQTEQIQADVSELKSDLVDYRDVRIATVKLPSNELVLDSFDRCDFNLESGNVWTSDSTYRGVLIPVKYLNEYISANPMSWKCVFAFLKDNNIVAGEIPHYCDGTSKVLLKNETKEYRVPYDCRYMYVYTGDGSNTIHFENLASESKIIRNLEKLTSMSHQMLINQSDFQLGTIITWNGSGAVDNNIKYRIYTTNIISNDLTFAIKSTDNFSLMVVYYQNNEYTEDTDWCKVATIPKDSKFRVAVKKDTENTSETANIEEFYNALISEHLIVSELTDLKKTVDASKGSIKNRFYKPFEIMSIAHRGYSITAPENTLPAFKLARKMGFDVVEADIRFTFDNVPVLLHDDTINRTARNLDGSEIESTISITEITYEQALEYDFGIWKGEEYRGTKIPTLEEFLMLCRNISIIPLLDTYGVTTTERAEKVSDLIAKYGLNGHTWINSSNYDTLEYLSSIIKDVYYGVVSWKTSPPQDMVDIINVLKERKLDVFISIDNSLCNISEYIELCKTYDLNMCLYSLNEESDILNADPYTFCIASDKLVAKDVLYNANIE